MNITRLLATRHWSLLPGLLLVVLLGLGATGIARAGAASALGEAQIAVFVDVTDQTTTYDEISIRLRNNTDETVLAQVVQRLGAQFRCQPAALSYVQGDPDFPDDQSVGATFYLPVVPRHEQYLPIVPFVEALAPYTDHLRIVYVVTGNFAYLGYKSPYSDKDVSFTMDMPAIMPGKSSNPLAFYGVNVIIKNRALTTMTLPNYPPGTHRPMTAVARVALAIGVAIVIIAGGLYLAQCLPRKREDGSSETTGLPRGGHHD